MRSLVQGAVRDSEQFGNPVEALFGGMLPSVDDIEQFVRDHFVYQSESYEIVRTPQWMLHELLKQGWFSGDCDDASVFAAAVLASYSYPVKFVAIRYSHPSEFEHVFVETEGSRIDPTVPLGTIHKELERMVFEI